jgi:hypothetical protein
MGMAASQARFFQLTARKADINFMLSKLANEKVSLARDSQKISREYQSAINKKVLKWSNNSGASYIAMDYQNLMRPSQMNQNKPYLLTDADGRVIVDSKYKKYAEMISKDGKPNGDWDEIRTQVLAEVTGIDASKIEAIQANNQSVEDSGDNLDYCNAYKQQELLKTGKYNNIVKLAQPDWIDCNGFVNGSVDIVINTKEDLEEHRKNLKSIGAYLVDPELFNEIVDNYIDGRVIPNTLTPSIHLVDIVNEYVKRGGDAVCEGNKIKYHDPNSQEYKDWEEEYKKCEAEHLEALNVHNNAIDASNSLLTATEESLIKFYDMLFSTISDKGWTYNENINDPNYLNLMLQNNIYTLTSVSRDTDCLDWCEDKQWHNSYTTDIASNCTNVFAVSDSDANEVALVEYQNKKDAIKVKESRIDVRMKNLETELSATNNFMKSVEEAIKKNTENLKLWG